MKRSPWWACSLARRCCTSRSKHYVINLRASYYDEPREQVDKLWGVNLHKIGVLYQDNAFGKTVLDGVKLALQKHNSSPVALGTFVRNTMDIEGGLKDVMSLRPQAVVLVGPYAPLAAIVKKAHAAGWRPRFLPVSFVGTEECIKKKPGQMPTARSSHKSFRRTIVPTTHPLHSTGGGWRTTIRTRRPSFVSLEGFVDAMVLVEGLKRA